MLGDESSRAVKRIDDVRVLRNSQFPEDAGPMAHPIRPESYRSINNFYTTTVYEKGAEVVRMYQTLFGKDGFRRGLLEYINRYDGTAATCDDFLNAMAESNYEDLSQFELWYSQAGTPRISVETKWDEIAKTFTLTLRQNNRTFPGKPAPKPLMIPVKIGILDDAGNDIPLQLEGEDSVSSADFGRGSPELDFPQCLDKTTALHRKRLLRSGHLQHRIHPRTVGFLSPPRFRSFQPCRCV